MRRGKGWPRKNTYRVACFASVTKQVLQGQRQHMEEEAYMEEALTSCANCGKAEEIEAKLRHALRASS